jgi:hypothetical protein
LKHSREGHLLHEVDNNGQMGSFENNEINIKNKNRKKQVVK